MIPGDNHLGPTGESAFQNAIVRLVLYHAQSSPRPDEDRKVGQKYGDVGELFGIPRKLARKDAEQLIENGLGYNELILFLDYESQCRFATPTRENQSRDENVGVEDDPHLSR